MGPKSKESAGLVSLNDVPLVLMVEDFDSLDLEVLIGDVQVGQLHVDQIGPWVSARQRDSVVWLEDLRAFHTQSHALESESGGCRQSL